MFSRSILNILKAVVHINLSFYCAAAIVVELLGFLHLLQIVALLISSYNSSVLIILLPWTVIDFLLLLIIPNWKDLFLVNKVFLSSFMFFFFKWLVNFFWWLNYFRFISGNKCVFRYLKMFFCAWNPLCFFCTLIFQDSPVFLLFFEILF